MVIGKRPEGSWNMPAECVSRTHGVRRHGVSVRDTIDQKVTGDRGSVLQKGRICSVVRAGECRMAGCANKTHEVRTGTAGGRACRERDPAWRRETADIAKDAIHMIRAVIKTRRTTVPGAARAVHLTGIEDVNI